MTEAKKSQSAYFEELKHALKDLKKEKETIEKENLELKKKDELECWYNKSRSICELLLTKNLLG